MTQRLFIYIIIISIAVSCGDIINSEPNLKKTPLITDPGNIDYYGWKLLSSEISDNLNSVFFISPDKGWIVGEKGLILRTRDGGKNWDKYSANDFYGPGLGLNDIYFINETIGWACGENGRTIKTTDGGNSWFQLYTNPGIDFSSVKFFDEKNGIIAGNVSEGEDFSIYLSADGGFTWKRNTQGFNMSVRDICVIDDKIGWAVGSAFLVIRLQEYGKNLSLASLSAVQKTYNAVTAFDNQHCWIVGEDIILRTSDNGKNWEKIIDSSFGELFDAHFPNVENGWIVGDYGKILTTEDGGASWNEQESGYTEKLSSIFFTNDSTGWAIGNNGMILHTTNGGKEIEVTELE